MRIARYLIQCAATKGKFDQEAVECLLISRDNLGDQMQAKLWRFESVPVDSQLLDFFDSRVCLGMPSSEAAPVRPDLLVAYQEVGVSLRP